MIIIIFVLIFLLFYLFFLFFYYFGFSKLAFIFKKFIWRYQEAPSLDNFKVFCVSWLSGNIVLLRIVLSVLEAFYLPLSK